MNILRTLSIIKVQGRKKLTFILINIHDILKKMKETGD